MFDEDDYYSDDQDIIVQSTKNMSDSKVLLPSSDSDFNHLTGQGESLLKLMKDRGFDLTQNQMKKMKNNNIKTDKVMTKLKGKTGFFDGGSSATIEELIKALKKAFSKADPHQVSCILSYILQKKNLSLEDRSKFSIKKCDILYGLGAYKDCISKAEEFLEYPIDKFTAANLSNFMSKSKAQIGQILSGYIDFLRARSYLREHIFVIDNQFRQKEEVKQQEEEQKEDEIFADTEVDTLNREIDHTQLQYNIKMTRYKNQSNLVHPYYLQFRHRQILQVVCGDYHTLFLIRGSIINKDNSKQSSNDKWKTQVFGIGQNTAGQIIGYPTHQIIKQPLLISGLSGKNIQGIWACKQSSLAYDVEGNIYQWGVKEKKDSQITKIYSFKEPIQQIYKGYQHYAVLTKSDKFYTWGSITMNGVPIYKNKEPELQQCQNLISFCCGNSFVLAVDKNGQCYGLGSNEFGQLGMPGESLSKKFRKLNSPMLGSIRKVIALGDCTFFINTDEQIHFCGRHSYNKQPIHRPKQAQFTNEVKYIISISGSVGSYYITNEIGQVYHWNVDNSVKFRLNQDQQIASVRYIAAHRGVAYRVRTLVQPKLCTVQKITENVESFNPINFKMQLNDQYGPYGNGNFVLPLKCQIFLSTYDINDKQLEKQNKLFLQSYEFGSDNNKILLNEIIEMRLTKFKIVQDEQSPWVYNLSIETDCSGKYYFYVLLQFNILYAEQLFIQVSERQRQNKQKNDSDKLMKQEERLLKAQALRKKLLQQKMKKQIEEQEKRKETQKRAEQALKKHMRQQEQVKQRIDEQRRAKKQLQTGGGFDLNKLKAKRQLNKMQMIEMNKKQLKQINKIQLRQVNKIQSNQMKRMQSKQINKISQKQQSDTFSQMNKSSESFLPNIRQRPSSKRKINLIKPSVELTVPSKCKMTTSNFKNNNQIQSEMYKTKTSELDHKTSGIRTLVRKGLSKNKKS